MSATSYIELLREGSLHPLAGVTGLVSTSRAINTLGILTGGGTLASDLTLAVTTSPNITTAAVGINRSIVATAPVKVNGAASADLSATVTFSADTFTGTVPGVVPTSANTGTKFLRDDGTWSAGTVVGVSSVTAADPITASAPDGDITIGVNQFTAFSGGIVPATGGASAASNLRADGTWALPGAGAYVSLQPGSPGTADTGHAHVTGTVIGSTSVLAGYSDALPGGFNGYLESSGDGTLSVLVGRVASAVTGPGIVMNRSRGTVAVPTATQANDQLFALAVTGWVTTNHFASGGGTTMLVRADGAPTAFEQPTYLDFQAGMLSSLGQIRIAQQGVLIKKGSIASATRPGSVLDVQGSLAIQTTLKTAAGAVSLAGNDHTYLVDGASAGSITFTLPTAIGCKGRRYYIKKIDISTPLMTINTTSSQTISGVASGGFLLRGFDDYIEVVSDDANWWIVSHNLDGVRDSYVSSDITVANTVAESSLGSGRCANIRFIGSVVRIKNGGKFSTTGTPTAQFKIKDTGSNIIGDSGAITMPSSVSNYSYSIEGELVYRTVSGSPVVYWLNAYVRIQTSSSGAMSTYTMALNTPPSIAAGDQNFNTTVTWGTASASNTITGQATAVFLDLGSRAT